MEEPPVPSTAARPPAPQSPPPEHQRQREPRQGPTYRDSHPPASRRHDPRRRGVYDDVGSLGGPSPCLHRLHRADDELHEPTKAHSETTTSRQGSK